VIEPRDERAHEAGPEPAWSESYYFNFYDPGPGVGGFTRIGIRPNEGHADGNLFLFWPGGGLVALLNKVERRDNSDDLAVGSLRYTCVEPLARWRIEAEGRALCLPRAADFALAREGASWGLAEPVEVALSFDAAMPPYGTSGRKQRSVQAEAAAASVAAGHFEQAGRMRGLVKVGDRAARIAGLGVRDKSWGPRDWSAPRSWRWFSMVFDEDLAIGVHQVSLGEREVQAGWVWSEGKLTKAEGFSLDTSYEGGVQSRLRLEISDAEGGKHLVEGEVLEAAPIRYGSTRINEGLTRFTLDGRIGHGIAEYLDN
jgi:hypothetical protein